MFGTMSRAILLAAEEPGPEIVYTGANRLIPIIPNLMIFFAIIFLVIEMRALRGEVERLIERLSQRQG